MISPIKPFHRETRMTCINGMRGVQKNEYGQKRLVLQGVTAHWISANSYQTDSSYGLL
jgi:hypothetical protein